MKKWFLLFSILMFSSGVFSQWQTYQTPTNLDFIDIKVINQNVIWACGYGNGNVIKTTDGGQSWNIVGSIFSGLVCWHITATDADNVWVTAGTGYNNRIFRTTNSGMNWTEQFYSEPRWIEGIKFFNNNTGIFLTGPGVNYDTVGFYVTRNGGLNWYHTPNSPVTTLLVDGCLGAVDTNFVWFLENNMVYRKTGGLDNPWQIFSIDTLDPYLLVSHFENATTGYVGDGGVGTPGFVLYKTTNGGQNWSIYSRDSSMGVNSLIFFPNTNLAFVNGQRQIRISTNSGVNWQYRVSYTIADSMYFYFMSAYDTNSVWLSANKGRLLKYNFNYIGINQISAQVPNGFKVYQNYPNPFNPTTKIKFDLPKSGNINFKVYDILGKVVYELSKHKQAGSYEVQFDGANLASGIYYYRVETDNYFEVRKMVLLK